MKLKTKYTVQGKKEALINPKLVLPNKSNFQYALYQMVKSLKLNPIWFLLFTGNYTTWNYILRRYHKINQRQEPFMDPKIILVLVLNLKHMPVIFKEVCSDYNFVRSHRKMVDDPILKEANIGI